MNEIIKPVTEWIGKNIPLSIGIGIFVFCLLFEISKVKIYPLRWLWKLISWPFKKIDEQRTGSFRRIVEEFQVDINDKIDSMINATSTNCEVLKTRFDKMEEQLKTLDKKQNDTEEKLDLLAAARIKNHVLNFARQCRKGEKHSIEDFQNLFREHRQYLSLVNKYQWVNDVYLHDFAYIERVYDECNMKNDFLG